MDDYSAPNPMGAFENDTTTIGEGFGEDAMKAEMESQYDAMNGIEAQVDEFVAKPPMPAYRGSEKRSIEDTMSDAYDWNQKPTNEKFWDAAADKAVDNMKANADKMGLSPEQYDALMQRGQTPAQASPEWQPVTDRVARLAPDRPPHQMVAEYADLHQQYVQDPKAVVKLLADNAGISLGEGAEQFQQVAERYQASFRGVAPAEAFEKLAAANDFLERDPEAGIKWLAEAYNINLANLAAGQPQARATKPAAARTHKPGASLQARMRAIYPEAARR